MQMMFQAFRCLLPLLEHDARLLSGVEPRHSDSVAVGRDGKRSEDEDGDDGKENRYVRRASRAASK
jgi:hypothetical protein